MAGPPLPFEQRQLICRLASQDGIEPTWEDARNKRGGRWLVSLAKERRHIELDRLWLETVSRGAGWEGLYGTRGGSGLEIGGGSPWAAAGGLIASLFGPR